MVEVAHLTRYNLTPVHRVLKRYVNGHGFLLLVAADTLSAWRADAVPYPPDRVSRPTTRPAGSRSFSGGRCGTHRG